MQLHSAKAYLHCVRRILIVAAHPDDEVLALGGHFHCLHPRILHLTTGGSSTRKGQELAKIRSRELERALSLARIPTRHRFTCEVVDQRAIDFLPEIFLKLRSLVDHVKPSCLLTHAYEGGHPDHDAASLVSHLVAKSANDLPVLEFPSYHNGAPFAQKASLETCSFLELRGGEVALRLSKKQQKVKQKMLAAFRSQSEFLKCFQVAVESFRPAPAYNFLEAPHRGILLYEAFGWDTYSAWRKRASAGMERIALDSAGRHTEV
jgi:LmbE family N-acetylglucosaminyl deacetylase